MMKPSIVFDYCRGVWSTHLERDKSMLASCDRDQDVHAQSRSYKIATSGIFVLSARRHQRDIELCKCRRFRSVEPSWNKHSTSREFLGEHASSARIMVDYCDVPTREPLVIGQADLSDENRIAVPVHDLEAIRESILDVALSRIEDRCDWFCLADSKFGLLLHDVKLASKPYYGGSRGSCGYPATQGANPCARTLSETFVRRTHSRPERPQSISHERSDSDHGKRHDRLPPQATAAPLHAGDASIDGGPL